MFIWPLSIARRRLKSQPDFVDKFKDGLTRIMRICGDKTSGIRPFNAGSKPDHVPRYPEAARKECHWVVLNEHAGGVVQIRCLLCAVSRCLPLSSINGYYSAYVMKLRQSTYSIPCLLSHCSDTCWQTVLLYVRLNYAHKIIGRIYFQCISVHNALLFQWWFLI